MKGAREEVLLFFIFVMDYGGREKERRGGLVDFGSVLSSLFLRKGQ